MRNTLVVLLSGMASLTAAPERIIFDTDSGPFNDDGVALVMLLQSPRSVTIEAVTTVPGNVWPVAGAEYMLANLKMMHRSDIPVYIGAENPLVSTATSVAAAANRFGKQNYIGAFAQTRPLEKVHVEPPPYFGFSGLSPRKENAVDFIAEMVLAHPGEITLFAIGPMTNIAMALRLHPDVETKIKRLVFMGGAEAVPGNVNDAAEFNFWFDPEAAQVVLRSKIREKVMFGLDICNHAVLTKAVFEQIVAVKTPVTEIYELDFGRKGFPGFLTNPSATALLWDELAAGYLIDPSFVTQSRSMYLDVDTRFSKDYGRVIPLDRKLAPEATPVKVMLNLDSGKAFAIYKELLTRPIHQK